MHPCNVTAHEWQQHAGTVLEHTGPYGRCAVQFNLGVKSDIHASEEDCALLGRA